MGLGKYTRPKPKSKKNGEEAEPGYGKYGPYDDSYNGCQADFGHWCKELQKAVEDYDDDGRKIKIVLGVRGYISINEYRHNTNKYPEAKYPKDIFGWGLGWEFTYSGGDGHLKKWVGDKAKELGLAVVENKNEDGNLLNYYLMPAEIADDESNSNEVLYSGDSSGSASSSSSYSSSDGSASVASVAYFFGNQFKTFETSYASENLQGERALANDEPVYNSIKTACGASLRSFSSAPDGSFMAWYPDYWGKAGNTVLYTIPQVELKDITITQKDSEFFSHVYCTGVDQGGNSLQVYESQGVVSIESDVSSRAAEATVNNENQKNVGKKSDGNGIDFGAAYDSMLSLVDEDAITKGASVEGSDQVSAILKELIYIPEGEEWRYTPKELYRRYGARPKNESPANGAKLIENRLASDDSSTPVYIMPFLYALHSFMEHWSKQNEVKVTVTFQPALMPGMRIAIEGMDLEMYIEGVSHTMSYSGGFDTTITAKCPVGSLVSGMVKV